MYRLVSDVIRSQAAARPSSIALSWPDGELTYEQLQQNVLDVASALGAHGVKTGDRVAVLTGNRPELVMLYFATARIGAILCPLNVWHRQAEHQTALEDCAPSIVFCESQLLPSLPAGPWQSECVVFDDDTDDGRGSADDPRNGDWASFLAHGALSDLGEEPSPEVPHLMLYTSGTTGRAKGVLISHRRTLADGYQLLAQMHLKRSDTIIGFFPTFHVGNWDSVKLFWMMGARVHLLRAFDEEQVLDAIEQERATVLLGMPTMFFRLLRCIEQRPRDLSSIRILWVGGFDVQGSSERMVRLIDEQVSELRLIHTYGLTEAGPYVTVSVDEDIRTSWGSVGRPMPGVEVEIRGDDGSLLPVGEIGDLWYRGPRMVKYWRNEQATNATVVDGWLDTGDVARKDADGLYWLVDRKKNIIRTGSQNVYSKEVETALLAHPAVADVAVFGMPDDEFEERVVAVVVATSPGESAELLADAIKQDLRRDLAGYKVPRQIIFVEALPISTMGKVQKADLRRLAEGTPVESAPKS